MKHGLLMLSALVLAIGCERANKDGTTVADDLAPGEVRLIGAGADPKTLLRYDVAEGTSVTLDMVLTISIEMPAAPSMPSMPPIRMSMTETCTDVEPDGTMRFAVKVGSVSADGTGPMADAMGQVGDMMKKMTYTFRLSPSGRVDDVQVGGLEGPMADIGKQMKDSIEQFAAPLPDQPVGKGATWRFKRAAEANGVKMATVNDFKLVDFEDQVATFEVKGRVVAPSQTINQKGMSIDLDKMDGDVTGRIANDLRRFAPSGTFAMTIDMSMSMQGQKMQMKMKMASEITAR